MIKILALKVLRDLRASLAQSVALAVIVALGVASFIALAGAYRDLGTSYNRTYEALHFADVTLGVSSAPGSVVDDLAQLDGVAAVTGRLVVDTGLELPAGADRPNAEEIRARLIGLPAGQHPAVNDVSILSGRYLANSDSQAALLESHFAQIYHNQPGDTVTALLNGQRVALNVVGVAASPEYLIVSPSKQEVIASARTFAVLFVPLPQLQHLAGAEGAINNIAVRFAPGANPDAIVQALQSRLTPYGLLTTTRQADQTSNAALKLDLDGYRELSELIPALILLVAAGALYVMLGRQVRAQRTQIGLMKAVGYGSSTVIGLYLALALAIGLAGSILGVGLGLVLERGITGSYAAELGIPLVQTQVYFDLLLVGVLMTLAVAALAGLGPARSSARLAPAQAMRQDAAEALVDGRTSFVERIVTVPLWLRLPLRNVFRVPRRSISTGLGVIFAFVLVLTALGLTNSMSYLLQHSFQVIERWDIAVVFDQPQTADVVQQVAAWPGVNQVQPFLQLPATVSANGQKQEIVLTALSPDQTMHILEPRDGSAAAADLASGHIILTSALADKLKLKPGDALNVDSLLGAQTVRLGGASNELMSSAGYISLAQAQAWSGAPEPAFNGLYLAVAPAQTEAIRSQLYHLPHTASVQLKSAVEQDWRSLVGLFYVFVGVLLVIVLAMAFALLFNAMTVNVLEQQREFATLRALGTNRSRIAALTLVENCILWVIVVLPGLVLGTWVAQQMGAAFQSDLFAFTIRIAPGSYLLTSIGILLTLLLAALPAVRQVNQLNLAEATKVLT